MATVIAIAQLRLRIQPLNRAAAGSFCIFDAYGTFDSLDGASV
jgi:hypothetical protein